MKPPDALSLVSRQALPQDCHKNNSPAKFSAMKLPKLLLPILIPLAQLPAQETYHVTRLPALNYAGDLTFSNYYGSGAAYGLNDSGDVVTKSGLLYSGGAITRLPDVYAPAPFSYSKVTIGWDVNNSGVVAGHGGDQYFFGQIPYGNYQHGFVYDSAGATMTDAGLLPGGLESRLFAINNGGTAAGWAQELSGSFIRVQAATFSGGNLTNVHNQVKLNPTDAQSAIFGITDTGKLAGYSISAGGAYQAFSYNGSTSLSLGNFGGNNSVALGLSDSATVGWAENAVGQRQAFVHDGSTLTNLDMTFTGALASSSQSAAAAVNDDGTIVGQAWEWGYSNNDGTYTSYNSQAFVSNGNQSWALSGLLNSNSQWKVESASDINASGQIAATASLNYYSNAVVLTPETAWTATGNGSWDTAANWRNSAVPGANGAAFLNLADGVTVTGPAADHALYALTLGSTGGSSTLQLQSGGNLTVRGDTELRTGAIIDATAATLETSYLHGNGTVIGSLDAGFIHASKGQTLTLEGNVNATAVELGDSAILKVSGVLHSAIASYTSDYSYSPQGGTIELTGNSTLGGNDIAGSLSIRTLNVADHSATLLTSGNASHTFNNVLLAGSGEVSAAAGIRVSDRLAGGGAVSGNVIIESAVVQPGAGNSLVINGDLRGSGLLVGSNITVTGNTTMDYSYGTLPSANIGGEDAVVLSSNRLILGGNLEMSGGTVTAANGLGFYTGSGRITGSGTVAGSVSGGGTVTATGALTLGDAASADGFDMERTQSYYYSYNTYGTLNAGNHSVTLLDSDAAKVAYVNLDGGTVAAANGLAAYRIAGHGSIDGALAQSAFYGYYSGITATGNLTLGDSTSTSGVNFEGTLAAGNHTVTLRDADFAKIGKSRDDYGYYGTIYHTPGITIAGGTIDAANGLELFQDSDILASGNASTSTVNGDLLMNNSLLEATDGNSLVISGTLSGYGVLLGNVTASGINATAGDVVLSNELDVGTRSMTVIAQSRAMLGQTTTLAGATIGASNGLGLASGHAIVGNGTVNPGAGQSLQLAGGILDAQAGSALAINGDLEGYGVTIGSVTVSGSNTLASAPTGQVVLGRDLEIGNRAAVFHSNSTSVIGSYAQVNMAGGSLTSVNGLVNAGEISGNGTIVSNVTLQSGVLNASGAGGIAISGSLGGNGIVVGNVTATTNSLASPVGSASISSVDIGGRTGTVYSSGRASIGTIVSQGGTLNTGVQGASISRYEGYGTLNGDVHMDGGLYIVDAASTLDITGNFTGYGIVVGSHSKAITAPTGTVDYNFAWSIGRNDITVYSLEKPKVAEVNLQPGGYIFSAQGWEFQRLNGGGTIGGDVTIRSILSPGFSPGTIVFENDLTLAMASTTVLEFAGTGPGQYDFLDIEEAFTMGGNLQVNFLDGFDPDAGLLPVWFSADSFSGTFSSISWSGLGSGKSVIFNSGTGRLGIAEISLIPEPSTMALMLPAAGALLLRRRRPANAPDSGC